MRSSGPNVGALLTLLAIVASSVVIAPARALGADIVVLRDTVRGAAPAEAVVDRALVGALREQAGFRSVEVLRAPLSDAVLAAGCARVDRACMERIASATGARWIVVRAIRSTRPYQVELASYRMSDPGAGVVRAGAALRGLDSSATSQVVSALVRRLYALPDPPAYDVPSTPRHGGGSAVTIASWSLIGASVAALSAGAVVGVLAQDAWSDHESLTIQSDADVDRAYELRQRAEDRSSVASALFVAGGVTAVAGVGLARGDADRRRRHERAAGGPLDDVARRAALALGRDAVRARHDGGAVTAWLASVIGVAAALRGRDAGGDVRARPRARGRRARGLHRPRPRQPRQPLLGGLPARRALLPRLLRPEQSSAVHVAAADDDGPRLGRCDDRLGSSTRAPSAPSPSAAARASTRRAITATAASATTGAAPIRSA